MTVELKDFVTRTLLDILKGVKDAGTDPIVGQQIVPTAIGSARYPGDATTVVRMGPLIPVKFDVAVTAETSDSSKAEGGFKVAVLGIGASAGGDLGSASRNVAVTRIQFEVPVLLPTGEKTEN
jgi:hypothetical protein